MMGEFILVQVLKIILSFVLAVVTIFVANGIFHQHWNFWIVTVIWLLIVFVGIVIFRITNDGDIDFNIFGD